MGNAVGKPVRGDQAVEGGGQRRGIIDVQRHGHGGLQPMFAHQGLGAAGQIDAQHFRALCIQLAGDGGTKIAGATSNPDRFACDGGVHLAV